ncbi:hypothetical protein YASMINEVIRUS_653 [Yasminevirus sp. GU-2018]|uniref:Uncharacterized protein n=1 Tax=Yasminevirus sp. GU-2018 TaxID=2420051 RepID=A0A5K0U8Q5_9VIRU|nr:hypothetical protein YASMINEVIRUS_653 [Yasminevirus sp. GU-2018]
MQYDDSTIAMPAQFGLVISDTIDERDSIIDRLLKERRQTDASIKKLTSAEVREKDLLDEIAGLKRQITSLGSVPFSGNDIESREQKCVDFLTKENLVDISIIRGKIADVNVFLDPLVAKDPATLTPREKSQIKMLKAQKRLLIGEFSFNNMLAKNMGEYYCDRILND